MHCLHRLGYPTAPGTQLALKNSDTAVEDKDGDVHISAIKGLKQEPDHKQTQK